MRVPLFAFRQGHEADRALFFAVVADDRRMHRAEPLDIARRARRCSRRPRPFVVVGGEQVPLGDDERRSPPGRR